MIVETVLVVLNAVALFVGRLTHVPGLDLIPAGVVIIGASDGAFLLWSAALLLPFFILSPTAMSAAWVVLPVSLIVGVLAAVGLSPLIALALYYLLSVAGGVLLGHVGPRYGTFLGVNAALNTLVVLGAGAAGIL